MEVGNVVGGCWIVVPVGIVVGVVVVLLGCRRPAKAHNI